MKKKKNLLRAHRSNLLVALAVCVPATVAACGGGAGGSGGGGAQTPGAPARGDALGGPAGEDGAGQASHAPAGADGGAPTTNTDPHGGGKPVGTMRPIEPTAMGDALKELGLDPKNLPPLNKVSPDKIRKVMSTFTKALGTKCTGCHDADDFRKATPHMKIAARMWNELVRGYTLEGGGAVYCDSCHAGKMEFVVRDPGMKGISAWMDENFVSKLRRVDGAEHGCEACHGDPFEGRFLARWAK